MSMKLHPDIVKAIKALLPTQEIDGKMYLRIDKIAMSRKGLTLYYQGQAVLEIPVLLGPGSELFVTDLDMLCRGVTFGE